MADNIEELIIIINWLNDSFNKYIIYGVPFEHEEYIDKTTLTEARKKCNVWKFSQKVVNFLYYRIEKNRFVIYHKHIPQNQAEYINRMSSADMSHKYENIVFAVEFNPNMINIKYLTKEKEASEIAFKSDDPIHAFRAFSSYIRNPYFYRSIFEILIYLAQK
jgi:hypothetical protein